MKKNANSMSELGFPYWLEKSTTSTGVLRLRLYSSLVFRGMVTPGGMYSALPTSFSLEELLEWLDLAGLSLRRLSFCFCKVKDSITSLDTFIIWLKMHCFGAQFQTVEISLELYRKQS